MNGTYKQQNQQNLNVDQTLSYIGLYVDWMDNPMGLAMWDSSLNNFMYFNQVNTIIKLNFSISK